MTNETKQETQRNEIKKRSGNLSKILSISLTFKKYKLKLLSFYLPQPEWLRSKNSHDCNTRIKMMRVINYF